MYYFFGSISGLKLFEKNPLIKFILLVMLLGVVTEVVQLWIPERAFNVFDLLSNIAGVAIGAAIIKILHRQEVFRLRKLEF